MPKNYFNIKLKIWLSQILIHQQIFYFLLILFIFSSYEVLPQGRWERIDSPTNNFLRRITISDTNTVWASGHNGTIIKSTDQGNSWTVLPTNTNKIIINHSAVNNQLIFAITWELENPPFGTNIMKSSDGGFNWQTIKFPVEYEYFQSIYFFNANEGIVAGSRTYLTSNGGQTWSIAQRDSDLVANLPFLNIKMLNESYGFACGGFIDVAGVIWRTTNGGSSWKTNGISPDEIFDMIFLDSLNIMALSGDPEFIYNLAFIKSTDGGQSWSYEELPYYAVSFGIDARDSQNIWSAAGYTFLLSTNRGIIWQQIETPDSSSVYDLVFINSQKGFACGERGVLLKYIPDASSIIEETPKPDKFILYQNYPNPFSAQGRSASGGNTNTKIKWYSPISGIQSLKIFNILGKEIATLIDEYRDAGAYEIEISSEFENLSSGVYFYKLQIDNYSEIRKMILIR